MTFVQYGNRNIEGNEAGTKEVHPPGTIHPAEGTLLGEEATLPGTPIAPPYCDPDDYFGPGFTARAVQQDNSLNPFPAWGGVPGDEVFDL